MIYGDSENVKILRDFSFLTGNDVTKLKSELIIVFSGEFYITCCIVIAFSQVYNT